MKVRRKAREVAFQILYQIDLLQKEESSEASKLEGEIERHFDHFQVPKKVREFSTQLVKGTLYRRKELDTALEKHLSNWRLNRLDLVDRNLLRLSAFELSTFQETPNSVTINEAIEMGKAFGTAETPSFLNGVLDSFAQEKTTQCEADLEIRS